VPAAPTWRQCSSRRCCGGATWRRRPPRLAGGRSWPSACLPASGTRRSACRLRCEALLLASEAVLLTLADIFRFNVFLHLESCSVHSNFDLQLTTLLIGQVCADSDLARLSTAQVAQLRLVAAEAEQAAGDGAAALRDETRRAARDQGLMRAELASASQQIEVIYVCRVGVVSHCPSPVTPNGSRLWPRQSGHRVNC
jgi:hypothetical protein